MEFKVIAVCLLLWLCPVMAEESANTLLMAKLDQINSQLYQSPSRAFEALADLEQQVNQQAFPPALLLRLQLLKCETLIESGDYDAAIYLAQMGEAQAKSERLESARPYFVNCLAQSYALLGNLKQALPLLDTAVQLSKRYRQPQALVNALRYRGQIDTDTGNFTSAIEDLRIALDIDPYMLNHGVNWSNPPEALLHFAMSQLLFATGDTNQALSYMDLALKSTQPQGRISHQLLLTAAKMEYENLNPQRGDERLAQSKAQISELDSPLEMAKSYTTIAEIDLMRGRIDSANQLAQLGYNTYNKHHEKRGTMVSQRLLAEIAFTKGFIEAGVTQLQQAIATATELNANDELAKLYNILHLHFKKIGDYQQAYQYLNKQLNANNRANAALNDARFIQHRTRLNAHDWAQTQAQQSIEQQTQETTSELSWAYRIIFILSGIIVIAGVWFVLGRYRHYPANGLEPIDNVGSDHQRLANMLGYAQKSHSPLALLLVDLNHIRYVDISKLIETLTQRLRDQDLLVRYSANQVVIILPHTPTSGAEYVSKQLVKELQQWQPNANIGIAYAGQFDTLPSMIKRAAVNLLKKNINNER